MDLACEPYRRAGHHRSDQCVQGKARCREHARSDRGRSRRQGDRGRDRGAEGSIRDHHRRAGPLVHRHHPAAARREDYNDRGSSRASINRLASATISSVRLFSRLEGLSANARVDPGAKITALQPFPTGLVIGMIVSMGVVGNCKVAGFACKTV